MYTRKSITLFVSTLLTLSFSFADNHEKEKYKKDVEVCGIVFKDVNDNGTYDVSLDVGIPDIHVTIDNNKETIELFTDIKGGFCIDKDDFRDDESLTVTIDESSFPTNTTYLMTVGNNPDVIDEESENLGHYGYTTTSTTPAKTSANPIPATSTAPTTPNNNNTPANTTAPTAPTNVPISTSTNTIPSTTTQANTTPTQRPYRYCVVTQVRYGNTWGRTTWTKWSYILTYINRPIGTISSQAASFYSLGSLPGTVNQKCFGAYTPPTQILQAINTQTMVRIW